MTRSLNPLVLAVDGGGTRCRVVAGDGDHLVEVETGPANVSSDFEGAVGQIIRGVGQLAKRLDCSPDDLWARPAFVGLAGVTGPVIADRLRQALPFRRIRIADDRPAAALGALGQRDGVLAHCGTGSFYAAQVNGTLRFSGGWGSVLGDEASAQWVARLALGMTLETVDGRRPPSPLADKLLSDFTDAAGIVRFAGTARPSDFGALAPLVTQHAAQGDALASDIMRRGADEIARALRHLGWRKDRVICLTGGIGPHYAPYLAEDMKGSIAKPEGTTLDGALALARQVEQEIADAGR